MSQPFALTSDQDIFEAVRSATSYDATADELPESQLSALLDDAKRDMVTLTGSTAWYDDISYGQALKSWTNILVKAAVENIAIQSYSIADEMVEMANADREDSQQIQLWLQQVNRALDKSDVEFSNYSDISLNNTSSYIG